MDREQLLKQEIDKIVAYGKSKGSISEDDIMARLEHLNATAEDMEMVFNALQNENVKVEETIEEDDIALGQNHRFKRGRLGENLPQRHRQSSPPDG